MAPETPLYGRREARGQKLWDDADSSLDAQNGKRAPYAGQTYYGRPAIKPSHYRWLVAGYLFVGGIAGASQVLAAVADLFGKEGDRGVVRGGRYLALLGAMASPVFLILDLQTPTRFYNMLRIFRKTSPMSIGSWTLAAFGTLSGLAAVGQLLEARVGRWPARLAGLPAAVAGAVMACYTGSLLSATSVPFWARVYRLLPPLFASSAMSTGAAATSLAMGRAGKSDAAPTSLERIALAASATELALTLAMNRRLKGSGLSGPIEDKPAIAAAYRFGVLGLGILVPLAIHAVQALTGRRSRTASTMADLSALAGGFILRAVLTFGGNDSAGRPEDYFRFAQRQAA